MFRATNESFIIIRLLIDNKFVISRDDGASYLEILLKTT